MLAAVRDFCWQGPLTGTVRHVNLFDEYRGKGLENKEKSLAFRFWMQDTERTLADAEVEAAVLLRRRCTWMDESGLPRVAEGPMAKLLSTEALTRAAQDLFDLVGPDGVRSFLEPTAPRQGRIEYLMRYSVGTTIYAGTSEVQRTLIAQRGLGLPR